MNFTWLPWIRSLFEQIDGGWSLLCYANTIKDCDEAIAANRKVTSMYEYKVERDED